MIMRPLIAAVTTFVVVLAWTPVASVATGLETDAARFIRSLADDAVRSLTDSKVPREERARHFRRLLNDRFAVRGIGRFVLARYWKKATEEQRKEYLGLFEDLIVASYIDTFAKYTGETLSVGRVVADGNGITIVHSEILRPKHADTIAVAWVVRADGDSFKIVDVQVEGVSMSTTMRSDFGSIMRQQAGKVSGLLAVLREKTENLKRSAKN